MDMQKKIEELEKTVKHQDIILTELLSLVQDMAENQLGRHCKCPFCKNVFINFKPFGVKPRPNAKCPVCGSLERHRSLLMWMNENGVILPTKHKIRLLHFAPESSLRQLFEDKENIDYWPVDYNENLIGIRKKVDIQNIDFESEMFDYIVCNHVMEHIPNDVAAFRELFRVLKKGGELILSVPFNLSREKTFEVPNANTDELRIKYFGQKDHVRSYGKDILARMERAGFEAELIIPNQYRSVDEIKRFGLLKDEVIFRCKKF